MILAVLFPYIILFYIFDCLVLVKAGHGLFVSVLYEKFQFKGSGLCLSGLLPMSRTFMVWQGVLHCSDSGIHIFGPDNKDDFFFFQEFAKLRVEGRTVHASERVFFEASSIYEAHYMADFLREVTEAGQGKREDVVKNFLAGRMDMELIKKRREIAAPYLLVLNIIATTLYICTFVLLPFFIYTTMGAFIRPLPLYILIALLYSGILVVSWLCHKKLHPAMGKARAGTILSMVLSPPSAMHAVDILCRNMFINFDALAVGAVFCKKEHFFEMARNELSMINKNSREDFWAAREKAIIDLLSKTGHDKASLLAPQKNPGPMAFSYCPYCRTEFMKGPKNCPDCGSRLKVYDWL